MEVPKKGYCLQISECFKNSNPVGEFSDKPDIRILKRHLQIQKPLSKDLIIKLVRTFITIVKNQPNLLELSDPLTVVGDIHGQYYDLLKIFELAGDPSTEKFLFLGDYVDRGMFSLEVMVLLCAIKINFPETFFLLRGNHECRQLTSFFNFRQECLAKHDQDVYEAFTELFDVLPIAAIINRKYLAVHGGISPRLSSKEDIKKINRFKQPTRSGLFCDLMWSDPVPDDREETGFASNSARGCSYYFGAEVTKNFLQKNNLMSIIRAHQVQLGGYKLYRWIDYYACPQVVTVFSAPNYCDNYGNKGAILKLSNNIMSFVQYEASPHPFVLSNFMNIFSWSCPFLAQKVSQMFVHLLKYRRNVSGRPSKQDQKSMNVQNFFLMEQMQNKLLQLVEEYSNTRKTHQVFVKGNEPLSISEELFEMLKTADMSERFVEFGPKVILSPLKVIQFEEDDNLL